MAQMQSLSARLPVEDVAWLASLEMPGAITPSDKLRALLATSRRVQESTADFQTSLAWVRDLIAPLLADIGAHEHRTGIHSEALRLVTEAVPQMMALLLSGRSLAKDSGRIAIQLEERLVARSMQLASALVRLSVTSNAPCYDPKGLDKQVLPLIELSRIVDSARGLTTEKDHG